MSVRLHRRAWRRLFLLPGVREVFQSDDEVAWTAQNRKALREKGLLRRLYLSYYGRHAALLSGAPGRTLEVGSGGGFFKEVCPEALTSDVLKVGQVELVVDAGRLPFRDGRLANIVFMGVLHHLREPFRFFEEAERALAPGGRIVFTEPYVSRLSYFVYKYLHHEACEFSGGVEPCGPLQCGNLAVPSVLFGGRRAEFERRFPGLRLRGVTYHDIFLYFLSGGGELPQPCAGHPVFPAAAGREGLIPPCETSGDVHDGGGRKAGSRGPRVGGRGLTTGGTTMSQEPMDVGGRRQVFIDGRFIAQSDGVELRVHPPALRGPVFRAERPWEAGYIGHATLIQDGDTLKMWYISHAPGRVRDERDSQEGGGS